VAARALRLRLAIAFVKYVSKASSLLEFKFSRLCLDLCRRAQCDASKWFPSLRLA
jgi:hypothetical protein